MRVIKSAIAFIVIAIMGVFLLVMTIKDKIELSKPPADIASMTESDFYNGRFVEGDIYEIWGEYATLEQSDSIFGIQYNTKTSAHYFLMPLETAYETGEPKFVSIAVRDSSDLLTAQTMGREFVNYINNDTDLHTTMHIKGKITKLKKDAVEIFDNTLSELEFTPSTDAVHYVINVGNDGSGSTTALLIGIGVTLVGVIGTFIAVIRGRRRGF